MSRKVEELKKKIEELKEQRRKNLEAISLLSQAQIQIQTNESDKTSDPQQEKKQRNIKEKNIEESQEQLIYQTKIEDKRLSYEAGIFVNMEGEITKKGTGMESQEEIEEQASDEEKTGESRGSFQGENDEEVNLENKDQQIKQQESFDFEHLSQEKVQEIYQQKKDQLIDMCDLAEQTIQQKIKNRKQQSIIENYFYVKDRENVQGLEDCQVIQIEDQVMDSKFMVNDLLWSNLGVNDEEKLYVCYSRLPGSKELDLSLNDFQFCQYYNGNKTGKKTSLSEIKKIIYDQNNQGCVCGGLDNGRLVYWDMRVAQLEPDIKSQVSDKSNYLPIIDLKQINQYVYSIGLEGRLCKWESRKLDEPVKSIDLVQSQDQGANITSLEVMPMTMEVDPLNNNVIYVGTYEGSVIEVEISITEMSVRNEKVVHGFSIPSIKVINLRKFLSDQRNLNKNYLQQLNLEKVENYYITGSFDWTSKIYKGNFCNLYREIKYHQDFVTSVCVNNQLCPLTFSTGDGDGKVCLWKLGSQNFETPLFEWKNSASISRISWNNNGVQLAVGNTKGLVSILNFPRNKLLATEAQVANFIEQEGKMES